jgi:hypothetical protein
MGALACGTRPDSGSLVHWRREGAPRLRLGTSDGFWSGLSEFGFGPEEVEIGLHKLSMCPQNGGGGHAQISGDDENSNCVRTTAQ